MIVKFIEVYVKPGHLEEYLASQEIWNRETRRAPGFLGYFCGQSKKADNVVWLFFYWRSQEDYDHWMATKHDQIALKAKSEAHYERLVVRILEPNSPMVEMLPAGFLPGETFEAADVQLWSEAYRASIVLRLAVRMRLFDYLEQEPQIVSNIAARLKVDARLLSRILLVLSALKLVTVEDDAWRNTGLASRTLVTGAPAYQGNIILHNARPEHFHHWLNLEERLNGVKPDARTSHEEFILGMSNTAKGGQAKALLDCVDLRDARHLLDVGGGAGSYAISFCERHPKLSATILDLPETEALAREEIRQAGMEQRVVFLAGDFRKDTFPQASTILHSNVLRGETPEMVADMLRRTHEALEPNGVVIIHDLFPETPPAPVGIQAALFGLHVANGSNMSLTEMADVVISSGFELELVQRLPRYLVMNGVIVGRSRK